MEQSEHFEQVSIFDFNAQPEIIENEKQEVITNKTENYTVQEKVVTDIEQADLLSGQQLFPYEIGEQVMIVLPDEETSAPEDYFYLKDFSKSSGEVIKVIEQPLLQYEVVFKGKVVMVYHSELELAKP